MTAIEVFILTTAIIEAYVSIKANIVVKFIKKNIIA